MSDAIKVLDHGFVRLVDTMGDEQAIVDAARVSYQQGTQKTRNNRGLIRYLMRRGHTSPLEMCELKIHVKMPIFVARQWIRHRTASLNEVSGRYSVLPSEFYLPEKDCIKMQSKQNKQGGSEPVSSSIASVVQDVMKEGALQNYQDYENILQGYGVCEIARETARMVLPLSLYTEMYWKIDLHNLLHFLRLRLDSHAQYEIRVYAEAIAKIVQDWVPIVWEAFVDYKLEAHPFSRQEMDVIRRVFASYEGDGSVQGTPREVREFFAAVALKES